MYSLSYSDNYSWKISIDFTLNSFFYDILVGGIEKDEVILSYI